MDYEKVLEKAMEEISFGGHNGGEGQKIAFGLLALSSAVVEASKNQVRAAELALQAAQQSSR
ncbi:MAG: hypothetical protein JWN89_419 [Parcubacteria group bacterium]|nr:hypothetical protein [Parcubacteria group bacterium]